MGVCVPKGADGEGLALGEEVIEGEGVPLPLPLLPPQMSDPVADPEERGWVGDRVSVVEEVGVGFVEEEGERGVPVEE